MTGSAFRYFATADEIRACFLEVEEKRRIKYVKSDRYLSKDILIYHSINEIPDLGISKTGDQLGDMYLVLDEEYNINLKRVDEFSGITSYRVYEGLNPNSIYVRFNGFYGDDCLIWNIVGTMKSKDKKIPYSLFMDIKKSLKKIMKKASYDCFISREAEELYWKSDEKLRLLGLGWDQPKECDIKLQKEN